MLVNQKSNINVRKLTFSSLFFIKNLEGIMGKMEGKCMKAVDEFGVPTYPLPRSDSIMARTERDCYFDTDCPIGFYCDRKYGVCIKR